VRSAALKISVAMTTYNGAQFVREQLDSILAQSRLPDELIVCDDRSSDGTAEILRDFASNCPFDVKVLVNDRRLGSTKNFEKAISLCSGDIIVLCDQDDIWRAEKLSIIEGAFAADSELGLVLSNADLIGRNGERFKRDLWTRCRLTRHRLAALRGPRRFDLLLGLPFTTGAAMAFRARFKPLILPIPDVSDTFIHDRWIAVMIAAVAKVTMLPEKLFRYRIHGEQQLGVGKVPLALRVFIPHRCRSDAAGLTAMHDRLDSNSSWHADAAFWKALQNRRRHVIERAGFSTNVLQRATQVASEFRSGRYVRYPYGLIVPFQDLLAGTR
jgi:glycosyltransferase involved in cell wall biosynthesis